MAPERASDRPQVTPGNRTVLAGALLAAAAVASGAYGAHGVRDVLITAGYEASITQRLGWFETAVQYHMVHALGLLVIGALGGRLNRRLLTAATLTIIIGVVLFSGSLYAMTFLGEAWRRLGMITPIGGLAFISGWVLVAVAAWRHR